MTIDELIRKWELKLKKLSEIVGVSVSIAAEQNLCVEVLRDLYILRACLRDGLRELS